jgi:hypothetical protein
MTRDNLCAFRVDGEGASELEDEGIDPLQESADPPTGRYAHVILSESSSGEDQNVTPSTSQIPNSHA